MTTPHTFGNWRKSRRSGGGNNCVEVAFDPDGTVGMRHSKDPTGPMLVFTASEWATFAGGVRDGEFDGPITASRGAAPPLPPAHDGG